MKNSIAEKLNKWAVVLFVLSIIGSIILGISCGVTAAGYHSDFNFLVFLLVCAVGIIVAYFQKLLISGLAEAIEQANEAKCKTQEVLDYIKKSSFNTPKDNASASPSVVYPTRSNVSSNPTPEYMPKFVTCKSCGEDNSSNSLYCINCGSKL